MVGKIAVEMQVLLLELAQFNLISASADYYVMMYKICGLYALSLTKEKYVSYRQQQKLQM